VGKTLKVGALGKRIYLARKNIPEIPQTPSHEERNRARRRRQKTASTSLGRLCTTPKTGSSSLERRAGRQGGAEGLWWEGVGESAGRPGHRCSWDAFRRTREPDFYHPKAAFRVETRPGRQT